MRFLHVGEKDDDHLTETVRAIRDRLAVPDKFVQAEQHSTETLSRIRAVMQSNPNTSFRSQISHMNNTCIPYDELTAILEHLPELKIREKVPYRIELNSILKAFMAAHGLLDLEEIEYADADKPGIGYEQEWIAFLTDSFRNHYENTVMKNGPVHRPIKETMEDSGK